MIKLGHYTLCLSLQKSNSPQVYEMWIEVPCRAKLHTINNLTAAASRSNLHRNCFKRRNFFCAISLCICCFHM